MIVCLLWGFVNVALKDCHPLCIAATQNLFLYVTTLLILELDFQVPCKVNNGGWMSLTLPMISPETTGVNYLGPFDNHLRHSNCKALGSPAIYAILFQSLLVRLVSYYRQILLYMTEFFSYPPTHTILHAPLCPPQCQQNRSRRWS